MSHDYFQTSRAMLWRDKGNDRLPRVMYPLHFWYVWTIFEQSTRSHLLLLLYLPKTDIYAASFPFRNVTQYNTTKGARIAGNSRRDKATTAHNAQRCYLGRSRCNLNLIARYFGRAYACKVGRGLIKRLRAALRRHADELARFASPGLRVPARPRKDRGRPGRVLGCCS